MLSLSSNASQKRQAGDTFAGGLKMRGEREKVLSLSRMATLEEVEEDTRQ